MTHTGVKRIVDKILVCFSILHEGTVEARQIDPG